MRDPAPRAVKLPASVVFAADVATLPERDGYPTISCELDGAVAYLHFPFYNGAMATVDCRALTEAIAGARRQGPRVLVLMGGPDYWSNGLHLGRIETASSPADESWANINAMNDCVKALIEADDLIVVAAMRGNAGAGGVFLALAADEVWMREGVVLNPHYKDMGNLYGSEYWTYLLPRRVGEDRARSLAAARLPMGAAEAARLGLVDRVLAGRGTRSRPPIAPGGGGNRRGGRLSGAPEGEEGAPSARRGSSPARRLSRGGAREHAPQFLGLRSELPYRPPQLHSQDSEIANARHAGLASRAAETQEVPGNGMSLPKPIRRKLDLKNGRVDLSHGAGGRAMGQLIEDIFHAAFDNDWLRAGNDQSAFDVAAGRMVMTTDAYVVSPIFFPGGDIGSLAVNGTINDIAMAGARPLYLSASFIIEEGFPLADLKRVAASMGEASRAAGTPIITGDTKVVERGKADKVFVSTAGVGVAPPGLNLSSDAVRPGDVAIVSGTMGDHGVAVMSKRENLEFETQILSDTAALHGLVAEMVKAAGPALRVMRDPTRGGLAATLNEFAHQSGVGFSIEEAAIPIRPEVAAACEFLGLDPLNVANEGKLVAIVAPEFADALLSAMKAHPLGANSAVIGRAVDDPNRFVEMRTAFGGGRIVDWLSGEQLPRIC